MPTLQVTKKQLDELIAKGIVLPQKKGGGKKVKDELAANAFTAPPDGQAGPLSFVVTKAVVTIPGVRLRTPGNSGWGKGGHWAATARHAKEQRSLARSYCGMLGAGTRESLLAGIRLKVRVVRIGGRKMDIPNILAASKALIDGLADWLGVNDKSDWYDWQMPTQESGPEYAVRIELETAPETHPETTENVS